MPHRYRKKPVEVEAAHFRIKPDTGTDNGQVIADWCGGTYVEFIPGTNAKAHIEIDTLEGTMIANLGDYIIKGTRNEFYPCKPGPFADTFELIEDGVDVDPH